MAHTPPVTDPSTPSSDPRDQATARFLAELSHELRTPLGAIVGFADAMRGRAFGPLSETYAEHAALICAAGRHLLDLTDDLADLAAVQEGRLDIQPEAFDAAPTIAEAVDLMSGHAQARGVVLRAELPNEPLMIMADPRRLRQIVFNLISNALKATPAEGSITVTAVARAGAMSLSVADTGVGIAAEELARLGEGRLEAGQGGIGLLLVRALAGAHGGTMHIQSAAGGGTTVSAQLPVLI
jgi:cell cycle sensor histidine kinase DivJ